VARDEIDPGAYLGDKLNCDIVMKGGITSGVVYPGAVIELAKRYRFRNIGGASAGAIAAAVVAAAEHNREHGGFVRVAELPNEIAGPPNSDPPFMLQLFQPDPRTRPLFDVAIAFLQNGLLAGLVKAVTRFWRFPALALAVAVTSICLGAAADADPVYVFGGVFAAIVILVIGLGSDVLDAILSLRENDFGLSRLGPDAGGPSRPALTEWLHGRLQEASGKDGRGPLTFADLWGVPEDGKADQDERRRKILRLARNPHERAVNLQMMTTNLTHGRPLRLPVDWRRDKDAPEEGGPLLFEPDQLEHFFPHDVVAHLVEHAPPLRPDAIEHLRREAPTRTLLRFPLGAELPVIVATRMSLSFPVLISVIPLWELDYSQDEHAPRLKPVLFSDGGITSNFPVHFFDSPLPAWPTFGLHLAGFRPGETWDPDDPSTCVSPPAKVTGAAVESWVEVSSLFDFVIAIKDAMQNWRDNAQSRLPGFRERIVHIKLGKGEGGLNLAMERKKIEQLTDRGSYAGRTLADLFSGPGPEPQSTAWWNDHRYARYRTAMSLIERHLRVFRRGYEAEPDRTTTPYPDRIKQAENTNPYALSQAELAFAQATTQTYLRLVEVWNGLRRDVCTEPPLEGEEHTLDKYGVPHPTSTLRAVPPV
jgi:predicted acylesterase/phospholipase RssA